MRTFDFTPLWRSTIGFDHLAELVDANLRQAADENLNYPPYNIERSGEDAYRITLALAGFKPDDVTITAEHNVLTIEGRKPDAGGCEYVYQGIAAGPFRRVFNLADYVQVKQASFENGVLTIDLMREIPEAMKPRRINIKGATSAPQFDQVEKQKAA